MLLTTGVTVRIEEVKEVLKEENLWFEPKMDNMPRFLFDNALTSYAYIVVRVDTGITKDNEDVKDCFKIYAVDLKNKRGWIRTRTVVKDNNWRENLLTTCRSVWQQACHRAKRENCVRIHIDEWLKQLKEKSTT